MVAAFVEAVTAGWPVDGSRSMTRPARPEGRVVRLPDGTAATVVRA